MEEKNPFIEAHQAWTASKPDASAPPRRGAEKKPAAAVDQIGNEDDAFITAHQKYSAKPQEQTSGTGNKSDSVGYAEDIARAALAKGARGLASVPGMLGDIPAMFGATTYRPPTTDEYMEKIKGISPGVKEALNYEPVTTAGRYAGSVAEFLPGAMIPGGGLSKGMRAIGGLGAGLGAQGVEDFVRKGEIPAEGWQEGLGKAAGAIAGGLSAQGLARGLRSATSSAEKVAAQRLAEAQKSDIASGTAKSTGMTVDQDLAPAVAAGPATDKLLKYSAGRASDEAVGSFNDAARTLRDQAGSKVAGVIDDAYGRGAPVKMFDEIEMLNDRIRQTNDANYTRVMGLPQAQQINHPEIVGIMKRMPKGTIDDVLESFRIQGVDPASFGLVKAGKTWAIPPQGASLRFWDEVKQNLDSQIGSYMDPITRSPRPGSAKKVADLQRLKTDLTTKVLDQAVPDYQAIRFEASELYGARNAMEAGYKFFADGNAKKLNATQSLVTNKLTPQQREEFAYGFAAAYKDALEKNATAALSSLQGNKADFNIAKMRFALGPQNADRLLGSVNSEFLNSKIKDLAATHQGGGYLKSGAIGMVGGAALGMAENVLQGLAFSMSPTGILAGLVGAAGSTAFKKALNAREQRIGEQVLRLAADPNQQANLGRLIAESKDARSFLTKFYQAAGRAAPGSFNEAPELTITPNRPGRKSGGRISSHEAEADRLIMAAERAKKGIGQKTQSILEKPDEIVVQALKRANQALEA